MHVNQCLIELEYQPYLRRPPRGVLYPAPRGRLRRLGRGLRSLRVLHLLSRPVLEQVSQRPRLERRRRSRRPRRQSPYVEQAELRRGGGGCGDRLWGW